MFIVVKLILFFNVFWIFLVSCSRHSIIHQSLFILAGCEPAFNVVLIVFSFTLFSFSHGFGGRGHVTFMLAYIQVTDILAPKCCSVWLDALPLTQLFNSNTIMTLVLLITLGLFLKAKAACMSTSHAAQATACTQIRVYWSLFS